MLAVGRRRTKDLHCPAGVREIAGRWYWQPTSKQERDARKAKDLPASVTLGDAGTVEARIKWAELTGHRQASKAKEGTVAHLFARFESEGLAKKLNGKKRSDKTVYDYKAGLKVLGARFGACAYGRTAAQAMQGRAIGTVDFQQYVSEDGRPIANRHLSAASAAFAWGISVGLTAYNPCLGVVKIEEEPRDREAEEWEVEVLRTMAYDARDTRMALMIDFEEIAGWRVSDIRTLALPQVKPEWIKLRQSKRGRKQRLLRSDEVNRILAEARRLPGATDSLIVFPTRSGEVQTLDAFEKRWAKLKLRTNKALTACEVPLAICDLHFQDLRSKAHDDAEDAGMEGHKFLGNREEVADRHYSRRGEKVRPIR